MKSALTSIQILREPLLQFFVLGGLLFALDQYVLGSDDNPNRIVIDANQRRQLASIFEEGQGREPSPEELQALIVQWSQNEVLYREARRMGLDEGDDMIRQRLILKLRNVLFGNIVLPEPDESELRAWFESNRERFDEPATFDFEQFALDASKSSSAQDAARLAKRIGDQAAPADYLDRVRYYQGRPRANLVDLFGKSGSDSMLAAPAGTWVVVRSERATHLARITARVSGAPMTFEQARALVVRSFEDEARKTSLADALREIVAQFEIVVTADDDSRAAVEGPFAPPQDSVTVAADSGSAVVAGGAR